MNYKDYTVRYTVWGRDDREQVKEKSFTTAEARETFLADLEGKDNFGQVLAFSDPQ